MDVCCWIYSGKCRRFFCVEIVRVLVLAFKFDFIRPVNRNSSKSLSQLINN